VNVLVTGGAGFIGSHLAEALVAAGHRVRVLDNLSTGSLENLSGVRSALDFREGDVLDPASAAAAVEGVDAVLHQAALPSVPRSFSAPVETTAVNCGGTLSMLEASRRAGVSRFVFASSSSVYGDAPVAVKDESLEPAPISPYAVSKLSGEIFCRIYRKTYGMATVALRYFNIFGPRQDPASQYSAVIPKFIAAVREGEKPSIYGDGTQSRDFTFVENVVAANLAALNAPEEVWGSACNIACGNEVSLLELLDELGNLAGRPIDFRFEPPRPGDVLHSRADIGRARRLLGYVPAVEFKEGLRRTWDFFSRGDFGRTLVQGDDDECSLA